MAWKPIPAGGHGPGPGQRLRELRTYLGWSQTELAILLGVRQATVSDWERGKVFPGPAQQRALRDLVYNSDEVERWLMIGEGKMPKPHLKNVEHKPASLLPQLPVAPHGADFQYGWVKSRRAMWVQLLTEVSATIEEDKEYPASYVCELIARVIAGIDTLAKAMRETESEDE